MIETKTVIDAKNIVQKYFEKKGVVIFSNEIVSVFKRRSAWFVEVENKKFAGIVIVKSSNGEVMAAVEL
jgi:hypothetical protein